MEVDLLGGILVTQGRMFAIPEGGGVRDLEIYDGGGLTWKDARCGEESSEISHSHGFNGS